MSLDAACALGFADPGVKGCVLDVTAKDKVLFLHPITMRSEPINFGGQSPFDDIWSILYGVSKRCP